MELFEVKAEIPPETVEAVDMLLQEEGLTGWNVQEDVIVKRAWVVGIFTSDAEAKESWVALEELLPAKPLQPAVFRAMGDRDWKDSYKAHFKASRFGRLHWVPVWERDTHALGEGEVAIWLDPGLAFGTGNHETTRLCAERLVTITDGLSDLHRNRLRVVDAGCGSGILALSAARLGIHQIEAFDNDPEAVRVSEENAELNGLKGAVKFFTGDLVSGLRPDSADILMANIQADVLMRFSGPLVDAVAPGGYLILSGILAHENEQVRGVFQSAAPTWELSHRTLGEWSDIAMVRPK